MEEVPAHPVEGTALQAQQCPVLAGSEARGQSRALPRGKATALPSQVCAFSAREPFKSW